MELEFNKNLSEEEIYDLLNPKFKIMKIHDDGTSCLVSNIGNIKDLKGRLLKSYPSKSGYLTVWIRSLPNSQICYPRSVHRLVAEAFIPNPENKPEVNHIDANKFHNWYKNLEWVTRKENIQHMIELGHQIVGMNHVNSKWTDDQIREVCKMLEDPDVIIKEISRKTGVSIKTINHIRFDNGWPHIAKDFNIISKKLKQGPRFSKLSLTIKDLILQGKSDDEIQNTLKNSDLTFNMSRKNILDRIYSIRTRLI